MDFKKEKSSGLSCGKALNEASESNGAGSNSFQHCFKSMEPLTMSCSGSAFLKLNV